MWIQCKHTRPEHPESWNRTLWVPGGSRRPVPELGLVHTLGHGVVDLLTWPWQPRLWGQRRLGSEPACSSPSGLTLHSSLATSGRSLQGSLGERLKV